MLTRRLLLALAATASLAIGAQDTVAADAYPSRTVTLIVPYAAGGASDTVARIIAESMTQTLGQQMIVENVGGASGTIGAARVARADPDGYTVMLHTPSHATNTLLFRKLPYDPATAFQPLGVVTETPMTVVGKADLPPNSASELFDYIRTNKDQITIGNAGLGGPSHLCGMLIMSMLDAPMTPVSYKGVGPAMIDLLGGQIDLMCDQATNTISHIRSGKIKAYAVTTKSRIADLPDLPTARRGRAEGLRDHGLAWALCTGRHSAGGGRQACECVEDGGPGPAGDEAAGRSCDRTRSPGAGEPRGTADDVPGRDRQVGAAGQSGWRLRRLELPKHHAGRSAMLLDYVVIGGGIVGVSTAMHLLECEPGRSLLLLEKEPDLARHQTGRNSGVIHAGVYYAPGSLKARFSKEGAEATIRFAREHGVPFERCGKLLVATSEIELQRMEALEERCRQNEITVERLDAAELRAARAAHHRPGRPLRPGHRHRRLRARHAEDGRGGEEPRRRDPHRHRP